jgi:hypothetical protein
MTEFPGQCLCGAVRFFARAPSLFCGHCHCRYCRQAHGAAFATWVGFPADAVRVESGADSVQWYQSSEQSRRGFCRQCGSMMFFESTCAPGERHIARAAFPGDIDREPELHTFYDRRVSWAGPTDDLLKLVSDDPLLAAFQTVKR